MADTTSVKAISSYNINLKQGSTVIPIKTTPDIGTSVNMLETTDLSSPIQTFIPGIKQIDGSGLQFTANYTKDAFLDVKGLEGTEKTFTLSYGNDGNGGEGVVTIKGIVSVGINGSSVDSVQEMTITIAPSEITLPSAGA